MIVYPALDVMNGQCVRLLKGDFKRLSIYDSSPVDVARQFSHQGTEWLHLIDLDGVRDPVKRQISIIDEIIQTSTLKVQTGGGIRTHDDVTRLLAAGSSRVVIGSLAIQEPDRVKGMIAECGSERICLAADVRRHDDEYVIAVSGWQKLSPMTLESFIADFRLAGLRHVLCTDISRDGTLQGCNRDLYRHVQHLFPDIALQASGGVQSLDDLRALQTAGVIVGKALHEGVFTLEQALEAAC